MADGGNERLVYFVLVERFVAREDVFGLQDEAGCWAPLVYQSCWCVGADMRDLTYARRNKWKRQLVGERFFWLWPSSLAKIIKIGFWLICPLDTGTLLRVKLHSNE